MGCCCSSRRAQLDGAPVYYYCPQALEERQPLSASVGTSALSTGLLVDTNLDTSTPDTYRSPPAPMPYDTDLGRPPTPPPGSTLAINVNKIDTGARTSDSEALGETISGSAFEACSVKEVDCKNEADSVPPSPKKADDALKLKDLTSSLTEEEDCCPTCLEEYDDENPRIITKCEHHFHLACILEWMERSDTCPVCDQEMDFDQSVYNM
ncbi:hypothetical protein MKX03_008549 [Papaver bracteatum]|nr:hypothetical protein MKX03_008549 [Papaver bracteatum]